LFSFNEIFLIKFFKIIFASIMMGLFFRYLVLFFENQLLYNYYLKSLYLIMSVFLGFIFYLLLSLLIKAFKYEDIKLKY
jgi:putative peptidoglycan lipid II flippase